jgi:D-alanyl-D-alanine dipeptidase
MKQNPEIQKFTFNSNKFDIEIVYSDPNHHYNIFVDEHHQSAYLQNADFIVSKPIYKILQNCEQFIPEGMKMRLYDCMRPVEAQLFMKQFKDKLNIDYNMLSEPGAGGHPRGMAIDCALVKNDNLYGVCSTDYGTAFDDLNFIINQDGSKIAHAHRNNLKEISFSAKQNRLQLEIIMQKAALLSRIPLMPLPQEWWDFRLPKNKNDYGHIIASFKRILLGIYDISPEIHNYDEFYDCWVTHFDYNAIPIEKRHIFDESLLRDPPAEEDFIFYPPEFFFRRCVEGLYRRYRDPEWSETLAIIRLENANFKTAKKHLGHLFRLADVITVMDEAMIGVLFVSMNPESLNIIRERVLRKLTAVPGLEKIQVKISAAELKFPDENWDQETSKLVSHEDFSKEIERIFSVLKRYRFPSHEMLHCHQPSGLTGKRANG